MDTQVTSSPSLRAAPPLSRALPDCTALELAELLREGAVTSEELTCTSLEAIARANPTLNAFVDVLAEQALREARAADKQLRRGRHEGQPFLGVPIGIKDLNLARGSFTRFGSRAFERLFTPLDDATTARLRKGGFVIVGKTATSELGTLPVVEPEIHPPTRNPWDLGVSPGGSSGGAGSALAAGLIPIAQGSDAGGSIRIPASFCHLFGFKPSRGRVEHSYGLEDDATLYTVGPMAHAVEDAAAMLDVLAGITVGKPHWAPLPTDPFLTLARRPPRRMKVRFVTGSPFVEVRPEIAEAVVGVARALRDHGHQVDEGAPLDGPFDDFLPIYQHLIAEVPLQDWSTTQPVTRWLGEAGRKVKREDAARRVAKLSREVLAWFGEVDAWITPTVAVPPPAIGAWRGRSPSEVYDLATKLGAFTAPFNVSGQPAASLPCGLSAEGHPIGVQIVGRPLADGIALALSRQVEESMPWRHRHPRPFVARTP